jgi:aminocarboxymuconate-semialdehyde decarboxylase
MNRRTFVQRTAAGMAGFLVQSGRPGGRREVSVAGKRVKVIDIHSHGAIPGVMEMMGQKPPANLPLLIGTDRLRQMDAQGIDVEILSINPFWYSADRDLAARLIKTQNEKLAEFCAAHSDRFVGMTSVALQHPDLAVQQLEEGIRKLGLHGGSVGDIVNGDELAAEKFDPFWAKAEELGAPIFIHPQGMPELRSRLQGNGVLTNVIANPLGTTIALSHLIFEGTLDRFPKLKLCAAHGGGYLPSYADRSDAGCVTFPEQCNKKLKKKPTEYLKQIYFDSLIFTGEALRHLIAVAGSSQIMLGTDFPYPWTTTAVDHVLKTPDLTDAQRVAILGGNAVKLFGITA